MYPLFLRYWLVKFLTILLSKNFFSFVSGIRRVGEMEHKMYRDRTIGGIKEILIKI